MPSLIKPAFAAAAKVNAIRNFFKFTPLYRFYVPAPEGKSDY